MTTLERHELFEIESLRYMNNKRLLEPLVLGGGTMLRLCHELNRYSVDMDFYFKKETDMAAYYNLLKDKMALGFTVTDAQNEFNNILIEIKHNDFPRKLKIEINKNKFVPVYKKMIAFSINSTHQIFLDTVPLEQMMINKIQALQSRKEIRDAFDIEFLIRRGVTFEPDQNESKQLLNIIVNFSTKDFNVKLGSILPPDIRAYYKQNRFSYLEQKIKSLLVDIG